jgi:hypothetical protein
MPDTIRRMAIRLPTATATESSIRSGLPDSATASLPTVCTTTPVARTMVIDDGITRLALVILDVIGFMHDDVVDVRKMLPEDLGLTYTIIASTHNA